MVTLLRIAALILLCAGSLIAIEGLPQGADATSHARAVVQCLDLPVIGSPPPEVEAGEVGPPTPASCEPYLTSLYALTAGVLASLLFGGLGSLIYNVRRSRLVMERFDDTAQGTR